MQLPSKAQAIKDALFADKPEPKCSAKNMHRQIQTCNERARENQDSQYSEEREGRTKEERGYDDRYFHQTVIPAMKCTKCGKVTSEDYRPLATKYPDGMVV